MTIFTPRPNDSLTVVLPSETMRATVTRVINKDTVIVQIGQPMMKTHSYRKDDLVGCRRTPGVLGETWTAIDVRPALPDFPAEKPVKKPVSKHKTGKNTPKSVETAKFASQKGAR